MKDVIPCEDIMADLIRDQEIDDIELDDGAEAKPEADKEFEKHQKETEKELEKRVDSAEEINDAEAGKADLKDATGKKDFELKGVKKLILDESTLNEKIPSPLKQAYDNLANKSSNATRYEDRYAASKRGTKTMNNDNLDLENTEYPRLTPLQAMEKIRDGKGKDLRLVFKSESSSWDGDNWVTKVKPDILAEVDYNPKYARKDGLNGAYVYSDVFDAPFEYTTPRSGKSFTKFRYMPVDFVLDKADYIYDASQEGKVFKDQNKKDARAQYPGSDHFKGVRSGSVLYDTEKELNNKIAATRQNIEKWQKKLETTNRDDYYYRRYEGRIEDAKSTINYLENQLTALKNAESENALQKPKRDRKALSQAAYTAANNNVYGGRGYYDRDGGEWDNTYGGGTYNPFKKRSRLADRASDLQKKSDDAAKAFDDFNNDLKNNHTKRVADARAKAKANGYKEGMEMKRKLILSEDFDQPTMLAPQPASQQEVQPAEPQAQPAQFEMSNMISAMIKGEWDAVELYNGMLAILKDMNDSELVSVITEIVNEEYVHIGQLEKLLQAKNPTATSIEAGKVHDEQIQPVPEPAKPIVTVTMQQPDQQLVQQQPTAQVQQYDTQLQQQNPAQPETTLDSEGE